MSIKTTGTLVKVLKTNSLAKGREVWLLVVDGDNVRKRLLVSVKIQDEVAQLASKGLPANLPIEVEYVEATGGIRICLSYKVLDTDGPTDL